MPRKHKETGPPLVEVTWLDAVDRPFAGTVAEAKLRGNLRLRNQPGYLIHQGVDQYGRNVTVLSQMYDPPETWEEEGSVESITVIPTEWIIQIKYRRQKRKKAAVPDPLNEKAQAEPA